MNPFNPRYFTRLNDSTYAYGRSTIAVAQISVLLFTPEWALRVPVGNGALPSCSGLDALSVFCFGGPETGFGAGRIIALVVLVLVASGWRPRYTGIPHAWVTLSFLHAITLPDGGEAVATVMTALLVPLCLVDGRRWAWPSRETTTLSPLGRADGIAAAMQWALRAQVAGIYFQSALAKLGVPDWVNGSAMYYVVREHFFGATGPVGSIIRALTETPWGTATFTWGTMIAEVLIAVCILGPVKFRRAALVIAVAFHVGIIVVLGLWSFGLIMCGAILAAASLPAGSMRFRLRRKHVGDRGPGRMSHQDRLAIAK